MENQNLSRKEFLKNAAFIAGLAGATILNIPSWSKLLTGHDIISEFFYQQIYGSQSSKRGILINQDKRDDTKLISPLLTNRGYECETIEDLEVTEQKIIDSIDQIATKSDDHSHSIFYYSGHGLDRGMEYIDGLPLNDGNVITPYSLFESLGKIKGKKAIILDACHSGAFIDYLKEDLDFDRKIFNERVIDNYVAIASCPQDYNSLSAGEVGLLTYRLHHLLIKNSRPINLSKVQFPTFGKETKKTLEEYINRNPNCSLEIQRTSNTDFILL